MGEKFANIADFEGLDELTVCRRLAKQIVDNVIEKATEEVAKVQFEIKSTKFTGKRPASLQLSNLTPSIQIDLVPSRTPTPEEQDNSQWIEQQQATKQKRKIRVRIIEEEDEDQLAEEDKVAKNAAKKEMKKENIAENATNQKINSNENKGNSANRKKTSVSWTDSKEDEIQDLKQVRTQFNEDSLNNNTTKIKDKNQQKAVHQVSSNETNSAKINSIKFNSTTEPNHKNVESAHRKSSTERFDHEENEIDWPNYEDNELNKVASRFVNQIIEDAKKEVEHRLKPSTSRTSGLYIEDKKSKPNYQPWSLARFREILGKLMRSTCSLCKNGPTHSTTFDGSLADHV